LIQLQSEAAHYQGVKTLHDIDLHIKQGEKLALLGKSGSGKSTLLKLIYERYPNNTALVPQDYGLVKHLSVYHNVFMGRLDQHTTWFNLINLIRPWKDQVSAVQLILSRLQLKDQLFQPVGKLSGGQQQRVAIARSLFQQGQLLLADEPVSSIDKEQSKLVLSQLRNSFPTMILAMHDTQLALDFCDRIIGLKKGKILFDQPSSSLTANELQTLFK